ncbi:MAG: dTDP-glucose 4,6-dehydratase [Gemmatimonadetes bacterium]|jgi:dTDP-glucose 4,6-dehydratase|nr:dTDP-glucose 4,6-dehydratase [Gemmatimonadota bacterium]
MPNTVLVTGGAGFIGSNLVRYLLRTAPALRVVTLDALTYAGNLESLTDVAAAHGPAGDGRHWFVCGDVRDAGLLSALVGGTLREAGTDRTVPAPDAVLHLAAESHVDRSSLGPSAFVETNVVGTQVLLDAVRASLAAEPRPFRFVHVSTDEVYGTLAPDDPPFRAGTPLAPNSPYAASKAGADCLVRAYGETFGLPVLTTRCTNNYGPFQFPEKLIPLVITRALADLPLPVYGDGRQVRDWLHVEDHCAALWAVLTRGRLADRVYVIGGEAERANLDVVRGVLAALGKPESLITFVRDRPGHDRRYAMDISATTEALGWAPTRRFEDGLVATVQWYQAHEAWWRRVQSEAYRAARSLYLPG